MDNLKERLHAFFTANGMNTTLVGRAFDISDPSDVEKAAVYFASIIERMLDWEERMADWEERMLEDEEPYDGDS